MKIKNIMLFGTLFGLMCINESILAQQDEEKKELNEITQPDYSHNTLPSNSQQGLQSSPDYGFENSSSQGLQTQPT